MAKVRITADEFVRCVAVGMRRFNSSETKGHNHASTYERTYNTRLEQETVERVCGHFPFGT